MKTSRDYGKVAVIGIVGVPARYGGFETLVENLLDENNRFVVYCSGKAYSNQIPVYKGASLVYMPFDANGVQSIIYDIFSILHALFTGRRQILVLGVSGALVFPLVRILFPSAKIAVNIDGLEWKRAKWGKFAQLALKFFEKLAVNYSACVICDNQAIIDYVHREYGRQSTLIAYGGDHAIVGRLDCLQDDYALSICRIEPENNVHIILEAFSKSSCKLKFVGNWRASAYGQKLHRFFSEFSNIELIDPVYDISTLFEIRAKCKFYVHGHSAGGTNPSLVEMMHFKKPIVAFDCSYNRASLENRGVYFTNAETLHSIISGNEWAGYDSTIFSEIANRRYTWSIVRKQ